MRFFLSILLIASVTKNYSFQKSKKETKTEEEKPKLIKLDMIKFDGLVSSYDYSLILFYENWCKYSKNALKIFKELAKEP